MNKPKTDWEAEYRNLMQTQGFAQSERSDGKKRTHTRMGFKSNTSIIVQSGPEICPIINLSVGGLSFYSDLPIPKGHTVRITLSDAVSMELQVDSCHLKKVAPVLMITDHKYVVGARFMDEEQGYRVMAEVLRNHGDRLFPKFN